MLPQTCLCILLMVLFWFGINCAVAVIFGLPFTHSLGIPTLFHSALSIRTHLCNLLRAQLHKSPHRVTHSVIPVAKVTPNLSEHKNHSDASVTRTLCSAAGLSVCLLSRNSPAGMHFFTMCMCVGLYQSEPKPGQDHSHTGSYQVN